MDGPAPRDLMRQRALEKPMIILDLVVKNGHLVEKRKRVQAYKSCEYNGSIFDSRAEADYCVICDARRAAGEIERYERQVEFELVVNGIRIAKHRVDYLLYLPGGVREAHEVKGFESREWRMKKLLFEALYPEIPYVVIKPGGKGMPRGSVKRLPSRKLRARQFQSKSVS